MNDDATSCWLENQFLIAMPRLADSSFSNTVTWLWKHNAEGALGIVINRPLKARIADILDELDIKYSAEDCPFAQHHVLAGGPVEQDKGFVIHDTGKVWDSSIPVTPDLAVCTSREILQDIASGDGPERYLIALGCAGWDAGQLEREISENAWLTAPADLDLLFSRDYAGKLDSAAALLGVDLAQLAPDAGHS